MQKKNCKDLIAVVDEIEDYTENYLFDDFGLMYSSIDSHTNQPFSRDFITKQKVPRRAMFDPWSYWSYEDTIMTSGHYIDGLVLKYEVTGDKAALDRAVQIWKTCRDVYYQSQAYGGVGCFLRPYGGFNEMEKFGEPLGTDQAAPLFCGAYRLKRHVNSKIQDEITRVIINTLRWYADQNYTHRYYKSITVEWGASLRHQASFYLPALAFAARETDEKRWQDELDFYLNRQLKDPEFIENEKGLWWGFKQGGLLVLKDILGTNFSEYFTSSILQQMYDEIEDELSNYDEKGRTRRDHPESLNPGFKPYIKKTFDRYRGLGFPFQYCVHGARKRPRHEPTGMTALAGSGIEKAVDEAKKIFALRKRVPEDFTHFLAEDYEKLPEQCHLYARSVGAIMLDWWRNMWLLKWIIETS